MNTQTKINRQWKCTDPDTQQYGRQLTPTLFEFKEGNNGHLNAMLVDLGVYTEGQKESIINSYGYTFMRGDNKNPNLQNIDELYGKDANWIIAECIFETELIN